MKRWFYVLTLLVLLGACAVEAKEARNVQETFEIKTGQIIRVDISVAELEIEATDRKDVAVDLTVRCRWHFSDCDEALKDLEIASRTSSRRLTLELSGIGSWRSSLIGVEGTIQIPKSSPLEIEMGVADLEISGVQQDLRVDLGVGKLEIFFPESDIGEAFVDVGVGQLRFLGFGERLNSRRSFLVGNEVHWADGDGEAEIDIEVGVGEVTIRLE